MINKIVKVHQLFLNNGQFSLSKFINYKKLIFSIYIKTILLCLSFLLSANGQSEIKISGEVLDQATGAPIPGAIVTCNGLNKTSISDNMGKFYFVDLPNGLFLLGARRIGYKDSMPIKAIINNTSTERIVILMYPEPVITETQVIIGRHPESIIIENIGNKTSVELNDGSLRSIEQIIDRIPELEIVESGPSKLLRIRGAQLNGTLVLLDGRIINSSLTSQGDISAIPIASVKKIEIVKGGGYELSGLAGSVNFITSPSNSKISAAANIEKGSFGLESYNLILNHSINSRLNLGLDVKSAYSKGDFIYTNPRDSVEVRQNNSFKDLNFFGYLGFDRNSFKIHIKGRFFQRRAGVPGPMLQLTPRANYSIDEKELWTDATLAIGNHSEIGYITGLTSRLAAYNSPQTPTNFIPYNSLFRENSGDVKIRYQYRGGFDSDIYLSLRDESLEGEDRIRPQSSLGKHNRFTNSVGIGNTFRLPPILKSRLSNIMILGFRKDGGNGGDFWAPSATIRSNLKLPFSPGFDFSIYRTRRLPDLTDLYWKEDVFASPNPDLRPETSTGFEIGFDCHFDIEGQFKFKGSGFQNRFDNIIVWRKWSGDKFKPVNISKSEISGWDFTAEFKPAFLPMTIYWNADIIKPLNKEPEIVHHNKFLAFRPIGAQSSGIEYDDNRLKLKLMGHHIGKRYITEENTKSLPAVFTVDFSSEYQIKFKFLEILVGFTVKNLTDKQYEIIENQPEKPREYIIHLELSRGDNP